MLWFTLVFSLFALSPLLRAATIIELRPPHEIVIQLSEKDQSQIKKIGPSQRLVLRSQSTGEVLGFAEPLAPAVNGKLIAQVLLHERHALVAPGDRVEVPDFQTSVENYPGRGDLFLSGKKEISSRFKRLAWFGPTLGDGHALEKDEMLVDITTMVQAGVTNRLTIGSAILPSLIAPNLLVKYTVIESAHVILTPSYIGAYTIETGAITQQARVLLSSVVNTKLISHTAASVAWTSRHQNQNDRSVRAAFLRTELQAGWEYVLDNWDRILFGPTYSFEFSSVGGYFAYVFVWDHFHFLLGAQTKNFTELKLDTRRAYSPSLTLFWRF